MKVLLDVHQKLKKAAGQSKVHHQRVIKEAVHMEVQQDKHQRVQQGVVHLKVLPDVTLKVQKLIVDMKVPVTVLGKAPQGNETYSIKNSF